MTPVPTPYSVAALWVRQDHALATFLLTVSALSRPPRPLLRRTIRLADPAAIHYPGPLQPLQPGRRPTFFPTEIGFKCGRAHGFARDGGEAVRRLGGGPEAGSAKR